MTEGKQRLSVDPGDGPGVDRPARPGPARAPRRGAFLSRLAARGLGAVLSFSFARLLPAPAVPLVIDERACDPEELRGRPGAIVLFRFADGHREANICCPGCGQGIFYNDGTRWSLQGPEDSLTCPVEWRTPCCGWRGRLRDGYWRGR